MHLQPPAAATAVVRRRRRLVALGAVLVIAFTSCGSDDTNKGGSESDSSGSADTTVPVSLLGQVQYACSLAEHVQEERGDPTEWKAVVGPDADPGASEAAAVSSLLGGTAGYELPDHPELSAAASDLTAAVTRLELELLSSSLERIVTECAEVPEAPSDVSEAGQVDFACRLADAVIAEHGPAESWEGLGQDPAWHQAASVGALVGGVNGYVLPGSEKLSEAGKRIVSAVARIDTGELDDALHAFVAACPPSR